MRTDIEIRQGKLLASVSETISVMQELNKKIDISLKTDEKRIKRYCWRNAKRRRK